MKSCSDILVLVANENTATLSANSDGETHFLRAIDRVLVPDQAPAQTDPLQVSVSARHVFACELMMALGRGLRDRPYDGVIIFADTPMMAELRTVQTSLVSRLLIAHVVGTPSAHGQACLRGVAEADMTWEGTLQ